jgi:hypothetical protein
MAWILERNLGAWCDAVSLLFGTALSETEWEDIRRGVSLATGASPFRYRLGGPDGVEVNALVDNPPDVAHVWIDPNPLDNKIEAISMMCRYFTIQGAIRREEAAGRQPAR